jgi:HD-GYP domain-containing protein (c-di-GMP phosphodiesterase class II)
MRNPGALISLARLKTADDYTFMHSVAVCALMIALARQLGLDESRRAMPVWPACCTTSARQ